MRGLTLEERGAYNTLLDLIYVHDGALEDLPRAICDELHCNIRTWRRLKARLLELGKIYMHAGAIRNERADTETNSALTRVRLAAEAATKRWAVYNEIKRLSDAGGMLPTTTKINLSANTVPFFKRTTEKANKT
jgi:hypothetical protein